MNVTQFIFSNTILSGEQFDKLFIFSNGEILAEIENINRYRITSTSSGAEKVEQSNDDLVLEIAFATEIKHATKFNLNRKDCFYYKNTEKCYSFEPAYNLFIHVDFVDFESLGDVLAADFDHEKCYLRTYKIAFPFMKIRTSKFEKIFCENYELQNFEKFGSGYGPDKEHAILSSFTISDTPFTRAKQPENIGKSGIIKKWFEPETVENEAMIFTKRTYTKMVKDNYRKNLEKLSAEIEKICNIKLSYYEIDNLNAAGFKIIQEGGNDENN